MTTETAPDFRGHEHVHPELADHALRYERRVEQVTDRVFVAIGYGLANTIMIVGDGGIVVVDVMESVEAAAEARDALRAFSDLPVKALVYTHGHPDHVWGGRAWVDGEDASDVEVIAHESVGHFVNEFANILSPRYTLGGIYMYGGALPHSGDGFVVNGIGPRLHAGRRGYIPPTRTFTAEDDVEVAGIRMKLVFAPGESPDQIFVWLPDDRVLLSGDNLYRSYPNVYTIRGARFRDPRDWYGSLDKMRALRPEHLVPCHGGPISGAGDVMDTLTTYRDGIQYVFDQTIRGMNRGLTPDQLAGSVELPARLREHPYLRQLYGQVDFCVREIYAGLYGWFSGEGSDLQPPPPGEESSEIIALAGGVEPAAEALKVAVEGGRLRWAARLATHILRVDPGNETVKRLKATALTALAYETINANARHWWLTEAAVLKGDVPLTPEIGGVIANSRAAGVLAGVPVRETVAALSVRLDPVAAADVERTIVVRVPGEGDVALAIRRGVCAVEPFGFDQPDLVVVLTKTDLVQLTLGERRWADAVADGSVTVEGGTQLLLDTTALFDGWTP